MKLAFRYTQTFLSIYLTEEKEFVVKSGFEEEFLFAFKNPVFIDKVLPEIEEIGLRHKGENIIDEIEILKTILSHPQTIVIEKNNEWKGTMLFDAIGL